MVSASLLEGAAECPHSRQAGLAILELIPTLLVITAHTFSHLSFFIGVFVDWLDVPKSKGLAKTHH